MSKIISEFHSRYMKTKHELDMLGDALARAAAEINSIAKYREENMQENNAFGDEEMFKVGDFVLKHTGDYKAYGFVRGVFTMESGAVRYNVEHKADGGGSFVHIYSAKNLKLIRPANEAK